MKADLAVLKARCDVRTESERNYRLLQQLRMKPRSCMETTQFFKQVADARRVKTKLLFATTAVEETAAAIDLIVDGDYAIMKACVKALKAQIGTKRSSVAVYAFR